MDTIVLTARGSLPIVLCGLLVEVAPPPGGWHIDAGNATAEGVSTSLWRQEVAAAQERAGKAGCADYERIAIKDRSHDAGATASGKPLALGALGVLGGAESGLDDTPLRDAHDGRA